MEVIFVKKFFVENPSIAMATLFASALALIILGICVLNGHTKCIIREKKLMLAELYRNIGNFEESFKQLEELFVNPSIQVYVDCIKKQIEQKNNRTVIVEQS